MVTDEGAIYVTSNGGYNWRAAVQETVSATLNRSVYGVAIILLGILVTVCVLYLSYVSSLCSAPYVIV